jgi:hypothetical protein
VDYSNHRVLIWNTFPTASFTPADLVLGQSDFAHYQANDLDQDDTQDSECSDRPFNYVTGIYTVRDPSLRGGQQQQSLPHFPGSVTP